MLNYDKMDEVLNNLEAQADDLKKLSKTQEQFENALNDLAHTIENITQILNNIKVERENIEKLVESVEKLETAHQSIETKIETVLQDYKKVHSSFEYIELELKKNTAAVAEIQSELKKDLHNELESVKRNNRKLSFGIIASVGVSIVSLILAIVNLII